MRIPLSNPVCLPQLDRTGLPGPEDGRLEVAQDPPPGSHACGPPLAGVGDGHLAGRGLRHAPRGRGGPPPGARGPWARLRQPPAELAPAQQDALPPRRHSLLQQGVALLRRLLLRDYLWACVWLRPTPGPDFRTQRVPGLRRVDPGGI